MRLVAAVVAAIRQILLQGCDKDVHKNSPVTLDFLVSSLSRHSVNSACVVVRGAPSSIFHQNDEICSVYVPLCDEVQLKKRMIRNEN